MNTAESAEPIPHPGMFKVMTQLMKLRAIVLLQITAICAILVHDTFARYGVMDLERTWADTLTVVLITVVGGTLSAGGSNAINMWYDADIDPHMRRTMNRPVPQGHASPRFALVFGSIIAVLGSSVFLLVSVKAAFWSAFSVLFYVLVYSMWLKRRTPKTSSLEASPAQRLRSSDGPLLLAIPSPVPTSSIWVHPCLGCCFS